MTERELLARMAARLFAASGSLEGNRAGDTAFEFWLNDDEAVRLAANLLYEVDTHLRAKYPPPVDMAERIRSGG